MFRRRFAAVVDSQLDLFEREYADVIGEAAEQLSAYNRGGRGEAEERYGDYLDTIAAGRDALADLRDHYAQTVDDEEGYVRAFNRAVARRFPQFAFSDDRG